MVGKICGTGSYAPAFVLDNNDLSRMVDTSDEWIRERTGIARRHRIESDTVVSMAAAAGARALEDAGIKAEEVDLLIVSTFSSEVFLPSAACEVQKELGAVHAACFDLNAACTGFLFAYNTAQAYIAAGMCRTALLIGSESLSNMVDWTDRTTCILFGDGAGAAVVQAQEEGLFLGIAHSDGAGGDALTMLSRHRKDAPESDPDAYIRMNGQAVYKFAVKRVPEVIQELLAKAGLSIDEIDYFVLHQANRRIVEAAARRLKADISRFPMNLEEYGNTSSASIPLLLDEMNRTGMLRKGQKIILAGFGAGLSWGATLIEW